MKLKSSLESEIILTKVAMPHHKVIHFCIRDSHRREAKRSNREEKEKFNIHFSSFERRKRNRKFLSLVSRGKRKFQKNMRNIREGESENRSPFSRREREMSNTVPLF